MPRPVLPFRRLRIQGDQGRGGLGYRHCLSIVPSSVNSKILLSIVSLLTLKAKAAHRRLRGWRLGCLLAPHSLLCAGRRSACRPQQQRARRERGGLLRKRQPQLVIPGTDNLLRDLDPTTVSTFELSGLGRSASMRMRRRYATPTRQTASVERKVSWRGARRRRRSHGSWRCLSHCWRRKSTSAKRSSSPARRRRRRRWRSTRG